MALNVEFNDAPTAIAAGGTHFGFHSAELFHQACHDVVRTGHHFASHVRSGLRGECSEHYGFQRYDQFETETWNEDQDSEELITDPKTNII